MPKKFVEIRRFHGAVRREDFFDGRNIFVEEEDDLVGVHSLYRRLKRAAAVENSFNISRRSNETHGFSDEPGDLARLAPTAIIVLTDNQPVKDRRGGKSVLHD